jgi:hypothetical protein
MELTSQDIGWVFQSTLLFNEKCSEMKQVENGIKPKYLFAGRKMLDFIKETFREYDEKIAKEIKENMEHSIKGGKLFT